MISMETMYALYTGDIRNASEWAWMGIRRYPCNGDMHYNMAVCHEALEEWYPAWMEYGRAHYIYWRAGDEKAVKLGLEERMQFCRENYEKKPDGKYAPMEMMQEKCYGMHDTAFRSVNIPIWGGYFWETETVKRYAGIYRDSALICFADNKDAVRVKGVFLEVTEGQTITLPSAGGKYLLPVASGQPVTRHCMLTGGKVYQVYQKLAGHVHYYRLPAGTQIQSSARTFYGKPIPLHHEKTRRKLVLNLFVDGLAQCELEGEKFAEQMPFTAAFFAKGTVCTRTYATAEWTYPSIAGYVTGLDTDHHMMYHGELAGRMPEEYQTLAEYFQEKGYYTAMLNGDWRIIPPYGHARGYEQFVYQHQWQGQKADMLIGQVIEQIETFKETDQFLWVSIGDLHDIADDIELPYYVQGSMEIEEECGIEEMGPTSVKQSHSLSKIIKYRKMMRRIDLLLNALYSYLEANFKEEEILISLFADHGQGYLIPEGRHFCSRERTNVAFMFRGAGVESCVTDEVMSTADYIQIMCRLAGIPMKDKPIDGILPKQFGGQGRAYALCQSIHPKDPYYAAVYTSHSRFYFTNPYGTRDDGRFFLKKWEAALEREDGAVLDNENLYRACLSIIEEKIAPLVVYE